MTAHLLVTYEDGGETVVSGVANGTLAGGSRTVRLGEFVCFPAEYTAHLVPAANRSETDRPGDSLSASTSRKPLVSASANVTTSTGVPELNVGGGNREPAMDTTGDRLLGDVPGTGPVTVFDV